MAETQKEKLMRTLGLTADEAQELMDYDNKVDHNKKTEYDLTPEQEKATRQYRQTPRAPTNFKWTKRERKPNELKREIIARLHQFIAESWAENAENLAISNVERQIDFTIGGENFSITLTQHRKPKK